jgi:hypothetical protein
MSIYKRNGLLPVYKSDQSQDWQLDGYFSNWVLAKKWVPKDVLVSFRTPLINGSYTAPATMTIRKLSILGNIKTIVSTQEVTSGLQKQIVGTQSYYWRQQGAFTAVASEYLTKGCLYEIYMKDSNDNEFITDIFVAVDETEYYIYAEDNQPISTEDGQQIVFE